MALMTDNFSSLRAFAWVGQRWCWGQADAFILAEMHQMDAFCLHGGHSFPVYGESCHYLESITLT